MPDRYNNTKGCCRCIRDYLSYAVSVAGRRMLTLVDVATDLRTFFILWNDPDTVVLSCFLMASISAPLLVYWASSHNFNEAILAHKTFGEKRPHNCRERCHRNFYNAVAIPLVGVYLTSIQVICWWILDIVLSVFCQARHRREVGRLEQREFSKRDRSMPLIMPSESARFMAIVELSYESLPQAVLQLWVYFWHASSYFTLFDVCLSVGASLANMLFNTLEILYAARTRAMFFTDYLLYFMSGQIDDMLCSGVPVRRAMRNASVEECDISGFHTLYTSSEAVRNLHTNVSSRSAIERGAERPNIHGFKRLILPQVPDNMRWTLDQYEAIMETVLTLRRHPRIHVTLPFIDDAFVQHFASSDFKAEVATSVRMRGRYCNVRAARCCNRVLGCCGTRPGDVLCATNTRVLGERDGRGIFSCCDIHIRTRDPSRNLQRRVLVLLKNMDTGAKEITSTLVRLTVQYLIVGDLKIIRDILPRLSSPAMKSFRRILQRSFEEEEEEEKINDNTIREETTKIDLKIVAECLDHGLDSSLHEESKKIVVL